MPIRKLNLFNNQTTPNLLQGLGQSPMPLRGLERFMQKRGMSFPYPQGGNFLNPNFPKPNQGENLQEAGSMFNNPTEQVPPEKSGGIKGFLSRFSRKRSE